MYMRLGGRYRTMIVLLLLMILLEGTWTWKNELDQPLLFECPWGQGITDIWSKHHNGAEDRQWDFQCRRMPGSTRSCRWSGFLNDWDRMFAYQCPDNGFISGMHSYHNNSPEDRRHKVKCCQLKGSIHIKSCFFSPLNSYDEYFYRRVPYGYMLTGLVSHHHDSYEDRTFSFLMCRV